MTVYLDNNATTAVDAKVLEAMLPFFREHYGNPSSLHRLGVAAERGLAEARERTARALSAEPAEVVFTSGGTEANNLALRGAVSALRRRGDHAVTSAVEHPSVLDVFQGLEEDGLRVTYVAPDAAGRLDADAVLAAVEDKTILVSIMHVQNETGAVFPIEAIAGRAKDRARKVLVHSDGVQAFGKLVTPGPAVDLYTISAHKIHGPKGGGALRVASGARIVPLLRGGGQERGLRSGTEALPTLVGLGKAAELAHDSRVAFAALAADLAARFRAGLDVVGGIVNSPDDGVASTVNVSFPGFAAEPLLHELEARGVYVSTGSACASRKGTRSPVLAAMGLSDDRIDSALRFSFSRETTPQDIDAALAALEAITSC